MLITFQEPERPAGCPFVLEQKRFLVLLSRCPFFFFFFVLSQDGTDCQNHVLVCPVHDFDIEIVIVLSRNLCWILTGCPGCPVAWQYFELVPLPKKNSTVLSRPVGHPSNY